MVFVIWVLDGQFLRSEVGMTRTPLKKNDASST